MNFEDQIKGLLSDPEMMSKISEIAGSMGQQASSAPPPPAGNAGLDVNLGKLLPLISELGGGKGKGDARINLLMALKPFLSEKRAPYMDSAVAILKLTGLVGLGKGKA